MSELLPTLDARYSPSIQKKQLAPRRLVIGSKGCIPNSSTKGGGDSTNTWHCSRWEFWTGKDAVSMLKAHFIWTLFAGSGSGETAIGNGATIYGGWEINGHSGRAAYFSGSTSFACVDQSTFETDSNPEAMVGPYQAGFFRTGVNVSDATKFWPEAFPGGTSTAAAKSSSSMLSQVTSSGAPTGTSEPGVFGPAYITGLCADDEPHIVAVGCSIGMGEGDVGDLNATGAISYIARACLNGSDGQTYTAPIPYANLSMGSETIASLMEPNTGRLRLAALQYATDVIVDPLATNDFANSVAYATVTANYDKIIGLCRALGVRTHVCNILPRTTASAANSGAKVTASFAGGVMTVTGTNARGLVAVGQNVYARGTTGFVQGLVTSLGTGTGGAGTYNVTISTTISSSTVITTTSVVAANQTYYNSSFGPGNSSDLFNNTYLPAQLAAGKIHSIIDLYGQTADPANPWKWLSQSDDWTHPAPPTHKALGIYVNGLIPTIMVGA